MLLNIPLHFNCADADADHSLNFWLEAYFVYQHACCL